MQTDLLVILLLMLAAALAVVRRKLTVAGGIAGLISSLLIYLGSGLAGLCSLTAFFVCGVLATGWKIDEKLKRGINENNKGRRKASQVLANAAVATIVSIYGYVMDINTGLIQLLVAASFSSAIADTLSSELGNIYGKRFYNILTWRPDQRGLDGVISLEGTLAGIAGSIVIGIIDYAFQQSIAYFIIVVIAGTAGNLFDSFLGAWLERKGRIGNDAVNFLNTLIAALIAFLLFSLL